MNVIGVRAPMKGVVYPPAADLERYVRVGALTEETLPGAWMASFSRHAERVALCGSAGNITYGQLDDMTNCAAAAFLRMGLEPLDRVMFQMRNSVELIVSIIGSIKAGLIPVCTLASHRDAEVGYLARHAEAKAHFIDGDDTKFDFVEFAGRIREAAPSLRHIVVARAPGALGNNALVLEQLIRDEDSAAAATLVREHVKSFDPFQVVIFQLSGGTSGIPKIIPRFQNEYLYNMRAIHTRTRRNADEVVFCAGPMVHNAGMVCHWGPALLHGGAVITDHDLSVAGLRNVLVHHKPTWLFLMRPLLVRLSESIKDSDVDVSFVKAALTSSNAKSVRSELGMPGFHFFGMAEGLVMCNREGDPEEAIHQAVGLPVSELDQVRLVQPGTETDVLPGEVGEMICKGPYTLHGYYDAPERNREAFTSDGFYRSGDLMSFRDFGGTHYYVFEARIKDVINRGGEKISCEEVERALRDYPGLIDVAVVAMPDEMYIEKGCAFICMETASALPDVGNLGNYLGRKGLAKYKYPERVEPIDALPVTRAGKINKAALREKIAKMIEAERALANAPALHGVHHTARPTWKLAETVEFYRDKLGLRLCHLISARGWGREDHPDFLHFFFDSGNGSTIAFFYYLGTEQPEYLAPRTEEPFYRATHTAWRVEERAHLDAWRSRLELAGVEVTVTIQHELVESIYFTDPNGYPIEISVQTRNFSSVDERDAALTMEAALSVEADPRAQSARGASIEAVWQRKAELVARSLNQPGGEC